MKNPGRGRHHLSEKMKTACKSVGMSGRFASGCCWIFPPPRNRPGLSASHGALDVWNGKRAEMITGTFHEAVLRAEFPDNSLSPRMRSILIALPLYVNCSHVDIRDYLKRLRNLLRFDS